MGTLRTHNKDAGFRAVNSNCCPAIPARARQDGSGQPVILIPPTECMKNKRSIRSLVPTLCPSDLSKHSHNNPIVAIDINGPSRCLRSSTGWSVDKKHNFNVINHNSIYRRLTPIECERLQGFPDNWTKYGCKGEIISDTQRYKRIGNAVTVDVAEQFGIAIKKTYKEEISWN